MTEYNKELEYTVFYYDEGESYDGYNDESIGVLVPENTSNAEYARNYFSYFSENNPCSYISMLAYRLLGHFRDLYDKVYDDDQDFYDFIRFEYGDILDKGQELLKYESKADKRKDHTYTRQGRYWGGITDGDI